MKRSRIVIVGAGFAGAATAWALARRGVSDVLILEREEFPGTHSSGRNAAMIRQLIEEPSIAALARASARIFRNPPEELADFMHFKQVGSLLMGERAHLSALFESISRAIRSEMEVQWRSHKQASGLVPALDGASREAALWTETDGVIDAAALLHGYLKYAQRAGAKLLCNCEVQAIKQGDHGHFRLQTSTGEVEAEVLVNAAGAWAQGLAEKAGASSLQLQPKRRHLFVSEPLDWVGGNWPFVWDVSREFYFRPESGGLLLCAGDASDMAACDPPTDPSVLELLAHKLDAHCPGLSNIRVRRFWAGLRTFAPGNEFVVRRDPVLEGFVWVAALGGHGVTCSPAVGELAAQAILEPQETTSRNVDTHAGSEILAARNRMSIQQ